MRIVLIFLAAVSLTLAGCSSTNDASAPTKLRVVAAEDTWGNLAQQIGGDDVEVVSIITNPDTDPHDFEPTAGDGRTVAQADVVIVNGLGYDAWATDLVSANPDDSREVVNVGQLTNLRNGDNPHQWYSPTSVIHTIDTITAAYKKKDPTHADAYGTRRNQLVDQGFAQYRTAIDQIKSNYGNTLIAATESVFSPMAGALDLKLVTPAGFLNAVSEGMEPTAADKSAADALIDTRQVSVLVFNSQNTTPDVEALMEKAKAVSIPVVAVTETPPANTSFQDWQTNQLIALRNALDLAK